MKSGKVIVLCAPSGSGKTSLTKHLLDQKIFNLQFSISATTRQKRENENDKIDYHFLSLDENFRFSLLNLDLFLLIKSSINLTFSSSNSATFL